MQSQPYFVVVLAHSLHGRLRRIHVPHQAIYAVLIFALIGFLSVGGFLVSYLRMTWKVANYNSLRHEVDTLRSRYHDLQQANNEKNKQLATLEMFASEVSVAYGLKRKPAAQAFVTKDLPLAPSFHESLDEYNFLQASTMSPMYHNYPRQWLVNIRPSIWPVDGRLMSPFGGRTDPFSGEGAMHTGVDLEAHYGTPVRATADGIVVHAEWGGSYGKVVVVDHGNGLQSLYAHLSRFEVVPGQEIRRGDILGMSGGTGRVTSPHLHYEVRMHGTPVNPYPFLRNSNVTTASQPSKDFPF
jgi:murein DD-endopeptidase MepM/ murein hydrolase activator NlpD